ncbi:MAG: SPASM domain-containing protein, partial [Armatimonadota bacterium]|nr:SPASM domain-containing protein [Armatimonadota bacterium]
HVYFVNISGGEPYLRADLPELIDLADRLLTPKLIHIPTNAILPSRIEEMTSDMLGRLARNGRGTMLTIKPSFDGVGKLHDEIRGISGNFEKLMDTLDRLRKLQSVYPNLEVGLGTVISVYNIEKVEEIANFAHSQHVDSYISEIAERRSEMFNTESPITPSADAYEKAINTFADLSRKHMSNAGKVGKMTQSTRLVYYDLVIRILREQRQVLPCYGGISNAHISPYGDIWPCCILGYDKSMGNLRDYDYDFRRIWRSERAAEVRRHIAGGNCWCPLANQAYSNILCSPAALAKVALNMLRGGR